MLLLQIRLVDESPLWLKATNKMKKLESLIESARKFNGSNKAVKRVVTSEACDNKEVWKTWREILKHPAMIYRVVVAVFGWLIAGSFISIRLRPFSNHDILTSETF